MVVALQPRVEDLTPGLDAAVLMPRVSGPRRGVGGSVSADAAGRHSGDATRSLTEACACFFCGGGGFFVLGALGNTRDGGSSWRGRGSAASWRLSIGMGRPAGGGVALGDGRTDIAADGRADVKPDVGMGELSDTTTDAVM